MASDFEPGTHNGGRSCLGVSCLLVILSLLFLGVVIGMPILAQATMDLDVGFGPIGAPMVFSDTGNPYTSVLGSFCCCVGSIGVVVGAVLTVIDEPPRPPRKGQGPGPT